MDWRGKRVLVCGGAGFIGSHLSEALVNRGSHVTVADNLLSGSISNLAWGLDKITFLQCDVADPKLGLKITSPPDYVFHLAAIANPRDCEQRPDLAMWHNVLSLQNVMQLAVQWQTKAVVFPSSSTLYAHATALPIDEGELIYPNESMYNLTKKLGEDICEYYRRKHQLKVMCLRLFNCFGPRQSGDYLIPSVMIQALATGKVELWSEESTRDYTYVADTIEAMVNACEVPAYDLPINIGSGKERNIGDVAREIAASLEAEAHFAGKETMGPHRLRCNNLRAKEVLGWTPTWGFKDGLDETLRWFREQQTTK